MAIVEQLEKDGSSRAPEKAPAQIGDEEMAHHGTHGRLCSAGSRRLPAMPHGMTRPSPTAGGVLAAVDAVVAGKIDNAFCAVRPPGHHATKDHGGGYCVFNNVAIAAAYAQARNTSSPRSSSSTGTPIMATEPSPFSTTIRPSSFSVHRRGTYGTTGSLRRGV